jgi:hypothetical protein
LSLAVSSTRLPMQFDKVFTWKRRLLVGFQYHDKVLEKAPHKPSLLFIEMPQAAHFETKMLDIATVIQYNRLSCTYMASSSIQSFCSWRVCRCGYRGCGAATPFPLLHLDGQVRVGLQDLVRPANHTTPPSVHCHHADKAASHTWNCNRSHHHITPRHTLLNKTSSLVDMCPSTALHQDSLCPNPGSSSRYQCSAVCMQAFSSLHPE